MTDRSAQADAARYYSQHADELLARYKGVSFEAVHADLMPYLPPHPGQALDVGAGSGRDATWLANRGWSVVAVEPCTALRDGGRRLHPDANILWLDDTFPDLSATRRTRRRFELLLLSAVWMHVAPPLEKTALAALAELAAPKAVMSVSVRMGGDDTRRGFYSSDISLLKKAADQSGFTLVVEGMSHDRFDRPDVAWTGLVFRRR